MPQLSYKESYQMRTNMVGKACRIHFQMAPLNIVRASKQYMYDDRGYEYLDCITNTAHVGHCHPHVVSSGQEQMAKLASSQGFLNEPLSLYTKRLVETLPNRLNVCFFLNSCSEANDLAIRLARAYTGNEDIVVLDNSYLGNLESLLEISPLRYKQLDMKQKEYVHVAPNPDLYRGKYTKESSDIGRSYAKELGQVVEGAEALGRKIAAFIADPVQTSAGVHPFPQGYLKEVYSCIRNAGGVCISVELQVGLGRIGDHCWGFQSQDVIPDIVTCGKPLGNGHPMAVVATTKEIADSLGVFGSSYGGNPVACAIGLAVLDVISNEQLMSSAKSVGRTLVEGFRNIQHKHPMLGDIRGQGMVLGIEIVVDKNSRKPAKDAAELLAYKMKEDKIIIANDGPHKNILIMAPPLCFTIDNARRVIKALDRCLAEIECSACPESFKEANGTLTVPTTQITIPLEIVGGDIEHYDSDEEPNVKRARFEDLD